ncbi:hypothetical protein L1887_61129 [Cichorium endivia]|nr:hypothetical protein L1887_61129 [Cichorium endivia]
MFASRFQCIIAEFAPYRGWPWQLLLCISKEREREYSFSRFDCSSEQLTFFGFKIAGPQLVRINACKEKKGKVKVLLLIDFPSQLVYSGPGDLGGGTKLFTTGLQALQVLQALQATCSTKRPLCNKAACFTSLDGKTLAKLPSRLSPRERERERLCRVQIFVSFTNGVAVQNDLAQTSNIIN